MSSRFRDTPSNDDSKLPGQHEKTPMSNFEARAPLCQFSDLAISFSDSELRETAYEILVGACRSFGGKPLTYAFQSQRAADRDPGLAFVSLQRSLMATAARKVKKALGLTSSGRGRTGGDSVSQRRVRRMGSVGEMMRVQMKISEQTDSRIRRALLRISAAQLGRRIDTVVLPLELLQQLKPSDFPTQQDYETWWKRNLKLLEAGLLLHPYLPLDKTDTAQKQLQQIIHEATETPLETGKDSASMRVLRSVVMSLACRTLDGSVSEICHWADGSPLNLILYQMLLEACFDVNDEISVIEELDEVLELVKRTWVILGINQVLHNLCLLWVFFHHYVAMGNVENGPLFAANNLLLEVEKDVKASKDPAYSKILCSLLQSVLAWAEMRLLTYHDTFNSDNTELMGSVLSLSVLAAKIMVEDIAHEHHGKRKEVNVAFGRVDTYVRSSLHTAFIQIMERVKYSSSSKKQQNRLHPLSILAQEVTTLAFNEKAIFSPILKKWHPLAGGIAVATLHSCYGTELKQFISGIAELTLDAMQVLRAADRLEKDLVQIAVEDAVDGEDGGKSIIQEMLPYEAESLIVNLVKSWIKTRVDRLQEWIDRNIQAEVWDPRANKEHFAPSAVEVLRMVDETLEAFFVLPISMHPLLLPDLATGIDRCFQHYILKAKSGCGTRSSFVPSMPALTRCSAGSKHGFFKRKEKFQMAQRRKSQVGTQNGSDSLGILQLCCRINTLHHVETELEILARRINGYLINSGSTHVDGLTNVSSKVFELSAASCIEGVQKLCEATAYQVIFRNLSHVLLDGLYVVQVSSSRIEFFLEELEPYLLLISSFVHDRVRTQIITDIMRASFDGFLLVLLAGGPSRAFTQQDHEILEVDFQFVTDMFWSNGDGLPADSIEKHSATVKGVLPLFGTDSERLIECFKSKILEIYGSSARSKKLPLPPTSGQWNPTEPNTLLRVLCHRRDDTAAKFLKKTYNLPKKP